jgi:hypothetical protein
MTGDRHGWSSAYHFHTDKNLSITQAMKMRRGNDPRAGDLHCHRACYLGSTGDRLITVKEAWNGSTRAHFRRLNSSREGPSSHSKCSRYSQATSNRESMDYANYYHRFHEYLEQLIDEGKPYFFSLIERGKAVGKPDFLIEHEDNKWGLSKTYVTIIDENKKRSQRIINSYNRAKRIGDGIINIILVISEYTVAQLHDFERGGIGKFELFWMSAVRDYEISRCEQLYRFELPKSVLRSIDFFGDIERLFSEEERSRALQQAISEAIDRNEMKYRKNDPKINFSSPSEVDEYYEKKYGKELAKILREEAYADAQEKKRRREYQERIEKRRDFEEKEDVVLSKRAYYKMWKLESDIKDFYKLLVDLRRRTQKAVAQFEVYRENRNSRIEFQQLTDLTSLEELYQQLLLECNFPMINGLVHNKPLWALGSKLRNERTAIIALESEGYKQYTDWFLQYRIHVVRFFIKSEGSGILRKDRKNLKLLTDYWKTLNEEILIIELIKYKVLQYDYSTIEQILIIPKIEILTNGINLGKIYDRRQKIDTRG